MHLHSQVEWVGPLGKNWPLTKCPQDVQVKLRVLATTDLHMQVLSYNYQTDQEGYGQGFAHTASLIRQARQEVDNSILVDNGDLLCGASIDASIITDSTSIHPMIDIMDDLGYDAATPGNHDFDYGLAYLLRATMQAKFPFVSTNALINLGCKSDKDHAIFSEFIILKRQVTDDAGNQHILNIGITGFLPPGSIPQFDTNAYQIQTRDIIQSATKIIPRMKAAGADIIVALAHSGIGSETHVTNMENAIIPLAAIDGIDAIIAGHKHQVFPGPDWIDTPVIDSENGTIQGKPVVAPGCFGSHLGVLDLDLYRHANKWIVQGHKSAARAVSPCNVSTPSTKPDPTVAKTIAALHAKMLDWTAQPIGQNGQRLTSFFALASPSRAVQTIQRAQAWYVKTHFSDHYDCALPLLSSACAFKTGGYGGPLNYTDILPGILTKRCLADLYPFHNHIALLQMNGAKLSEWLERAASVFNTALPGIDNQTLKSSDVPAYLYETILELDYTIDLSQPARYDQFGQIAEPATRRIKNLTYAGQPVCRDKEYTLITNNFRQGGGGYYPAICLQTHLHVPAIAMQNILVAYFEAYPDWTPPLDQHWRFTGASGTRLTFRSSPKAYDHMDDVENSNIQPLGTDKAGYRLFELIL